MLLLLLVCNFVTPFLVCLATIQTLADFNFQYIFLIFIFSLFIVCSFNRKLRKWIYEILNILDDCSSALSLCLHKCLNLNSILVLILSTMELSPIESRQMMTVKCKLVHRKMVKQRTMFQYCFHSIHYSNRYQLTNHCCNLDFQSSMMPSLMDNMCCSHCCLHNFLRSHHWHHHIRRWLHHIHRSLSCQCYSIHCCHRLRSWQLQPNRDPRQHREHCTRT